MRQGARARGHRRAGHGRPNAKGPAPVHLRRHQWGTARRPPRRDHTGPARRRCACRSARRRARGGPPNQQLARLIIGSKPIDGGHYILDAAGRAALLAACPEVSPFVRPYVGSWEYLNGGERYILCLNDAPLELLKREPALRQRVAAVREFRQRSKSTPTRSLATTPTLYHVNVIPNAPFLVVPEVSSERREYVPIGWLEPPVVPSNLVRVLEGATKPTFALLTSAMHMAWLRHVGGCQAEERLPLLHRPRLQHLSAAARIRGGGHVGATRPARAGRARRSCCPCRRNAGRHVRPRPDAAESSQGASDAGWAVDRLYRRKRFTSEHERVEHLFTLYEQTPGPS